MIEKKVLEYFGGDELAASVFLRKYSFKVNGKPTETPQDLFHRLAKEFTRIDMKYDSRITEDKLKLLSPFGQDYFGERAGTDREKAYYLEYLSLLSDFRYIVPQGSGLSGIGLDTPISLSNCFFNGQMEDNIESIYDIAKSMAQVGKRRGGTSTDISLIRPRGAKIDNSANTSSGPTPFLDLLDVTGKIIGQEGRKMAMMITQDIRHPDVLEFITIKEDLSKVTSANLSTKINKEFLDAVEADKDYFLRYPVEAEIPEHIADILIEDDTPYNELVVINKNLIEGVQYVKRVRARELWDAIIYSAWKSAEPGILMWDNVIDYDPTSVYPTLKPKGTNPSLRKGTKVLTDGGIFPIEELQDNNFYVENSKGMHVPAKCFHSGVKPLYELTLVGGQKYYATAEHKWLVDGKKITTDQLQEGMYLPITFKESLFNGSLGNYEDGLFVGWLYGDGWYTVRGDNGKIQIGMVINKDDYNTPIRSIIESKLKEIGSEAIFVERDNGTYELNTQNQTLVDYLHNFGVNNKTKGLPTKIWDSTSEAFRKGFIEGLFTSDGHIDKSSRSINLVSAHINLIQDVKELLGFYGIQSSLSKRSSKTPTFPNGKVYDRKYESYSLKISKIGSQNHFKNLFKLDKGFKELSLRTPHTDYRSKYETLVRLKSITKTDLVEDVWDITVYDDTHTFHLSGCVTGNCSELPLGDLDSCRLIFTNLYSLISSKFTKDAKFEKEAAYNIFYTAQVMADNLVDLELEAVDRILTKINPKYAEVKHDVTHQWLSLQTSEFKTWWNIKKIGQNGRRTGTGLSGLADWYAAQGIDYGEPTALHELMDIKFRAEMDASIDLAILRGPFPLWENSLEYDGMEWEITGTNYWYRMLLQDYPDIAHRMSEHGRRNSGLSTIAPTGTTSIVAKISSGMEPVFKISYVRRTKIDENDTTTKVDFVDTNGVKWREHNVLHPAFREWLKLEYSSTLSDKKIDELSEKEIKIYFSKSPWFGNTAEDIDWEDRVKTQGILQKYITSSISSTINLPEDVDIEVIDSLYKLASKEGLKGLTVYREGSRSGVLVSKDKVVLSERPESIPCKIIRFMHEKTQWVAFVGLLNNSPYEIFTGINNLEIFPVPTHIEEGSIIKVTTSEGSRYDFRYEDTYGNINTVGGLNSIFNREFWNYARFTSALLRENVGLPNIIQIIDKLKFDNDSLNSWKSGIIRTLRQFIEDGTKIEGAKCPNPECGSTQVEFKEGCLTCMNCGNSNCS